MADISFIVPIFIILAMASKVTVANNQTAADLVSKFIKNKRINIEIPPIVKKGPLTVKTGFFLHTIFEVDPSSQTISVVGTLILTWTDNNLLWNPSTYEGITVLSVGADKVWTPKLKLASGVTENLEIRMDKRFDLVQVNHMGAVVMRVERRFVSTCAVDTEAFPYDVHRCELTFKSASPDTIVQLASLGVQDAHYKKFLVHNDEWQLRDNSIKHTFDNGSGVHSTLQVLGFQVSEMRVGLSIARNPVYYVVLVILPTVMATILLPLIPLVPVDCGERLSLTMSLFLVFVLFLLLVDNILPKGKFSSLTISMAISVVLILINLFESILVVHYDRKVLTIDNMDATAEMDMRRNMVAPIIEDETNAAAETNSNHATNDVEEANESEIRQNHTKSEVAQLYLRNQFMQLKNPKILIRRIDQVLFCINVITVFSANVYIISKLVPKYVR